MVDRWIAALLREGAMLILRDLEKNLKDVYVETVDRNLWP
jgi:hypothetical protein